MPPTHTPTHPLAGLALACDIEQAVGAGPHQHHSQPRRAAALGIHVAHVTGQLLLPGRCHGPPVEDAGVGGRGGGGRSAAGAGGGGVGGGVLLLLRPQAA